MNEPLPYVINIQHNIVLVLNKLSDSAKTIHIALETPRTIHALRIQMNVETHRLCAHRALSA